MRESKIAPESLGLGAALEAPVVVVPLVVLLAVASAAARKAAKVLPVAGALAENTIPEEQWLAWRQ